MNYLERDTFSISKTRKGPGPHMMAANMLTGGNVVNHKVGKLGGTKEVIPEYETLPVYEVEFIPAERRIVDRCSSLHRFNESIPYSERRASLGRREADCEACFPGLSLGAPA